MTVLIAFGTVEGQTGKIARFVADFVEDFGQKAVLLETTAEDVSADWSTVTSVVLAASVHQRRHPEPFEVFVAANQNELDARRTLLLSVSLAAAFPEGEEDANDYAEEMCMRTELDPDAVMLVAGAIHARSYDYFASQVLRHVVLRGRNFDPSVQEHEFTDWDALKAGLEAFLEGHQP